MKHYAISFETSEASITLRFEAVSVQEAHNIADSHMNRLSNGKRVFVIEELAKNSTA